MATRGLSYLSHNDAIMWTVEADPLLRSTIVALVVLDHAPSFDRVLDRVSLAVDHVPALRQRVVAAPLHRGTFQWIPAEVVDLGYHVRHIRLPEPGAMTDLLALTRAEAAGAFDRERPLWEFTLVEGVEGGRAAFIVKAHHVASDGIGSVQLATQLFDLTPDAAVPGAAGRGGEVVDAVATPATSGSCRTPGLVERWRDAVVHDAATMASVARRQLYDAVPNVLRVLRDPAGAAADTVETIRSVGRTIAPVLDTKSPVMTERRMATRFDTLEVPLSDLRAAAKSVGGTLNDGYLAAITGGMRRYHERHGAPVDELRMAMPISLRTDEHGAGGNHLTVLRCTVEVGVADPAVRIAQLHELGVRLRSERSLAHTEAIAGVLNLLPRGIVGTMLKRVDFLASNVPGVPVPLYLAGVEVERIYPFGPTAGSSVNLTLISYRDRCCVGIHSDVAAIPDGDVFLSCMREGFEEVLELRS